MSEVAVSSSDCTEASENQLYSLSIFYPPSIQLILMSTYHASDTVLGIKDVMKDSDQPLGSLGPTREAAFHRKRAFLLGRILRTLLSDRHRSSQNSLSEKRQTVNVQATKVEIELQSL